MVNRRVGNLRKDKGGKRGGFFSHYRPPPADHVKRQAERKGGKFDSIFKGNFDTFTPKEGDNTIRVLPAGWEGNTDYAYPAWVHFGIGADESSYLCLRKMKNGATCPICQEVARMKADGEGEDAKRIDCKERMVCWILDRSDRDETPALYSMPATLYKDINALCYSSKSGKAIFIDNPDDGYDVIVRRTGTKRNTRYLPQVDREATVITDDADKYKELEDWVQDNQVPDCLQFFDEEYLEKALSGEIDRNAGDDDGKDRRRTARRRDEDEDEQDEKPQRSRRRGRDEEEEDEEDAPPPRGRSGRSKPGKDDDLDDELPFDEDEDEPDEDDESENEAKEARQDRQSRTRRRGREEDEDEPEDRPRGNKRRPSRDEDEPDEDEGAELDEEDENPRRSRTRPRVQEDRSSRRSSGNRRV